MQARVSSKRVRTSTVKLRNGNKLSVSAMTFAEMIKLLHDGEYTKKQIQEKLGVANNTVQRWLEVLYRRKLVYIADWKRGPRGNPAAMWAFGYHMEDAPKPKPLTQTEYVQRYRAKQRRVLGLVAV